MFVSSGNPDRRRLHRWANGAVGACRDDRGGATLAGGVGLDGRQSRYRSVERLQRHFLDRCRRWVRGFGERSSRSSAAPQPGARAKKFKCPLNLRRSGRWFDKTPLVDPYRK